MSVVLLHDDAITTELVERGCADAASVELQITPANIVCKDKDDIGLPAGTRVVRS